jgi:hypothetical protein
MPTVVINVSELQNFDDSNVKGLADFLGKKLDGTVTTTKKEVTIDFEEGKEASRSCLRVLLRKYLHKESLTEDFRVISGGENSYIIKEKVVYTE